MSRKSFSSLKIRHRVRSRQITTAQAREELKKEAEKRGQSLGELEVSKIWMWLAAEEVVTQKEEVAA